MAYLSAQGTQRSLCGMSISRAEGMGLPQCEQLPKPGESILVRAIRRLDNLRLVERRPASATLLLLIASILLIRPMALSGEMGSEFSSLRTTSASVSAIVAMIFSLNMALSSAVMS